MALFDWQLAWSNASWRGAVTGILTGETPGWA